jgi:hypothetical protein
MNVLDTQKKGARFEVRVKSGSARMVTYDSGFILVHGRTDQSANQDVEGSFVRRRLGAVCGRLVRSIFSGSAAQGRRSARGSLRVILLLEPRDGVTSFLRRAGGHGRADIAVVPDAQAVESEPPRVHLVARGANQRGGGGARIRWPGTDRQSVGVADDNEQLFGPRHGDVESLRLVNQTAVLSAIDREPTHFFRPDSRDDNNAAVTNMQVNETSPL